MSSLHRIAVSDILDDFLDCPDAYSAMAHEISKLRQQLTAATTERNAALRRHAHATHCYQGESPDGCAYGAVDCLMDGAPIVAERDHARAALQAVEWTSLDPFFIETPQCPWCLSYEKEGHTTDCQCQAALGRGEGE